jgi:hypothetical protein
MPDLPAVETFRGEPVTLPGIETRDWFAWNNMQPTGLARFHVTGEVRTSNPGMDAVLVPRVPPGVDPATLLLDVVPTQAPGQWLQVGVWVPARYDQARGHFQRVRIFFRDTLVAEVEAYDID